MRIIVSWDSYPLYILLSSILSKANLWLIGLLQCRKGFTLEPIISLLNNLYNMSHALFPNSNAGLTILYFSSAVQYLNFLTFTGHFYYLIYFIITKMQILFLYLRLSYNFNKMSYFFWYYSCNQKYNRV